MASLSLFMTPLNLKNIQNVIFDLGGVIVDLSIPRTLNRFAKMAGIPPEKVKEIYYREPGFIAYEKGEINNEAFRHMVRQVFNLSDSDQAIDEAWNAMLLGLHVPNLHLLTQLKENYTVMLLSNTNALHIQHVNEVFMPSIQGHDSLESFFHKPYYSHVMHKRKPDQEIYLQVLEENNFKPEETVFLDDTAINIEGAEAVGIKGILVPSIEKVTSFFYE